MLIQHGAYLHAPDQPVLPVLVEKNRLDLIVPLLQRPGVDAGFAALMGKTPIHVAAEFGRTEIAKFLLERPEVEIDALDASGRTAAERAAEQGHTSTLRLFLGRAKTNSTITPNSYVRALHAAAASGQLDVMNFLLEEYNVCPSEPDIDGDAALYLAVKGGHVNMVRFLIERPDVDVSVVGHSGMAVIHHAASSSPEESATPIIQALVAAGANVNSSASSSDTTDTPLRYAIERKRTIVALTLLSCGADPSLEHGAHPVTGLTLLHHCMAPDRSYLSKAELRLVKELIKKGADTESASTFDAARWPDHTNGPPLFFAAAFVKSDSCVERLLKAGASADFSVINERAPEASNPQSLLMALFYYRLPDKYHRTHGSISTRVNLSDVRSLTTCIKLLLKYGARLDSVASEQSALQYACEVAIEEGLELLCVLLCGSTRRNVSLSHVEMLKIDYGTEESGSIPSDPRRIQRRSGVCRQLSDFVGRAFKQKKTIGVKKAS